jgi:hypothetical protein
MNAVVRIVLRALLAVSVFAVLIASVCFCWFYFYSGDIPHFSELAELAPESAATVPDRCSGAPIQVIPSASVGKNLRNALHAAEGLNDEILALQVSRNLFCNSQMRMLKRALGWYGTASTRAKWRSLRSARVSTLKKCLTAPALSETRCFANYVGSDSQRQSRSMHSHSKSQT